MNETTENILDCRCYSHEDATRLAIQRRSSDPSFEVEVSQFLTRQLAFADPILPAVTRALTVLRAMASRGRIVLAMRACLLDERPWVRSNAVIVLGGACGDDPLIERLAFLDHDPRVRANAVESLWGKTTPFAANIMTKAVADRNHRVAANGAYGLHLIEPSQAAVAFEALVQDRRPGHRIAAAWLLGKVGGTHRQLLTRLIHDEQADVRSAAFKVIASHVKSVGSGVAAASE